MRAENPGRRRTRAGLVLFVLAVASVWLALGVALPRTVTDGGPLMPALLVVGVAAALTCGSLAARFLLEDGDDPGRPRSGDEV